MSKIPLVKKIKYRKYPMSKPSKLKIEQTTNSQKSQTNNYQRKPHNLKKPTSPTSQSITQID